MENISVEKQKVIDAYNASDEQTKKVFVAIFGNDILPKNITEQIKTFEDAYEALGAAHPFCEEWDNLTCDSEDLIAYYKLRIITAALNEGWEPRFEKGERRWYCWYYLITKSEYDKLSDEEKSRVVGRGGYNANAIYGLVYANAYNASSSSYSHYGFRLAFKSEELAEYAGRQFAEIYADFCFKPC